ncbi:MAG: tetratricopeptide repeat protein [Chitinivibrionales bacterium]|nr:tetratricopeptide repeat protein [Chitinivibrionales bacterium]
MSKQGKSVSVSISMFAVCFWTIVCSLHSWGNQNEYEYTVDSDSLDALPAEIMKGADAAFQVNMKGLEALEKGDAVKAMEFFDRASDLLPNYTDAFNNKAVAYFRQGNIAAAAQLWNQVIALDPEYAIGYYNLGIVSFEEKKYERAHYYFQKASAKNPKFVPALVMQARLAMNDSDKKKALQFSKKAFEINPKETLAWQSYAYFLILNNDTTNAETVVKQHIDSPYGLRVLGEIAAHRGQIDESVKYLSTAMKKGGEFQILVEIAQILYDFKRYKEAQAAIHRFMDSITVPDADVWLLAGLIAKECNDITETQELFEKGMRYFPHDQLLRYNLAQIKFYLKEYAVAEKLWSGLSDTLNDCLLWYLRSLAARAQGQKEKAIDYIQKALSIDNRSTFRDLYGSLLYEQGKKGEAIIQFKKALESDPSNSKAVLNLALIERDSLTIEKSIASLSGSLNTCQHECADQFLRLSLLYFHSNRIKHALEVLESMPPAEKSPRIYYQIALYYQSMAEWASAIKTLEKALALYGNNLPLEYAAAQAYLQSGSYSQAILLLQQLIPLWQTDVWRLYYQLAYAYVKKSDFEKAQQYLRTSLQMKPDFLSAQGLLAFVYHELNQEDKAQALWQKILSKDPGNAAIHRNMGLMLETQGKYSQALEHYRRSLELEKENTAVFINIGNCLEAMGKLEDAMVAYTKAATSDKRDVALFNLFNGAKKQGNKHLADSIYQQLTRGFAQSIHTQRVKADMLLWNRDTIQAKTVFSQMNQKDEYDWLMIATISAEQGDRRGTQEALSHISDALQWKKQKEYIAVRVAFNTGSFDEAFALLLAQHDTSITHRYNKIVAAFGAGKYSYCIDSGKVLSMVAPETMKNSVYRIVGNASIKNKDWQNAKDYFSKIIQTQPRDTIAYYNCAVAFYNLGRIEDSWQYYQKAKALDETLKNSDIEIKYAITVDAQQGDNSESRPAVVESVDSLDSLYNEAVERQKASDTTTAIGLYQKIVAKDRNYWRAWNNLGTIYGAMGNVDKAIEYYKKSAGDNSDVVDGFANLVNVYIALEKYRDAEKWLKRGKKKYPTSELLLTMERQLKEAIQNNNQ